MAKKVNFKEVASQARFDIMASIKLPTPEAFQDLNDEDKFALYRTIFDTYHDLCDFLSASLNIDDLLTRYCND